MLWGSGRGVVALIVGVMVAFGGGIADASPGRNVGSDVDARHRSKLLVRPCGDLEPAGATLDCGWLEVPERRDAVHSHLIKVAYVIARAATPSKKPPLVFLSGGPGVSGVGQVTSWVRAGFERDRDVIFVDQRGVGASRPSLSCQESETATWRIFEHAYSVPTERSALMASLLGCRRRLVRAGVHLAGYNSVESARDFVDLRTSLRIRRWDLFGVSYGTGLAQQVLRMDRGGIRAVALDGVQPVSVGVGGSALHRRVDAVLGRTFDACRKALTCATRYPDLEQQLERVVARYNAVPMAITVEDAVGRSHALHLTGNDILALLYFTFYPTSSVGSQPAIINAAVEGNTALLGEIARSVVANFAAISAGVGYSVTCADRAFAESAAEFARHQQPRFATLDLLFPSPTTCARWDVPPIRQRETRAVHATTPVLVSSGEFDPITPPGDARRVARTLRNATVVEPLGVGHTAVPAQPCVTAIFTAFFADPSGHLDTACLAEMPPVAFP